MRDAGGRAGWPQERGKRLCAGGRAVHGSGVGVRSYYAFTDDLSNKESIRNRYCLVDRLTHRRIDSTHNKTWRPLLCLPRCAIGMPYSATNHRARPKTVTAQNNGSLLPAWTARHRRSRSTMRSPAGMHASFLWPPLSRCCFSKRAAYARECDRSSTAACGVTVVVRRLQPSSVNHYSTHTTS